MSRPVCYMASYATFVSHAGVAKNTSLQEYADCTLLGIMIHAFKLQQPSQIGPNVVPFYLPSTSNLPGQPIVY